MGLAGGQQTTGRVEEITLPSVVQEESALSIFVHLRKARVPDDGNRDAVSEDLVRMEEEETGGQGNSV